MADKKHVTAPLRYRVLCNFHVIATTLGWQRARQKVALLTLKPLQYISLSIIFVMHESPV